MAQTKKRKEKKEEVAVGSAGVPWPGSLGLLRNPTGGRKGVIILNIYLHDPGLSSRWGFKHLAL